MKSPVKREECPGLSPTALQLLEVGRSQKGGRKIRRECCHRRPKKEVLQAERRSQLCLTVVCIGQDLLGYALVIN